MTIAMTDGSTYENQLDMLFAKDMPSREETQGPMPAVDMPKRLAQPNTYTPNEEDQLSNPIAPQIKDQNDPYSWGMGTAIDEKGLAKVPNPTPKFHEIMDQMDYIINPEKIQAGGANKDDSEYQAPKLPVPEHPVNQDYDALTKEQVDDMHRGAAKILGGEWKSPGDVKNMVDEAGSIRIWENDPHVQEFLKNADPKEYEAFPLKEMLPGGYQGDPNDRGTIIIRKKSYNALVGEADLPENARSTEGSVTPEQQAQLFNKSEKTQAPEKTLTEKYGPSGYGETYDKFVDALDAASKYLHPSFIPTAEQFRDAPWKEKLGFILGTSMMLAAPGRSGIRTLPKESITSKPMDFWNENLQAYKNLEHPADKEAFNAAARDTLASKEFATDARTRMDEIKSSQEEWQKINPEGKGKWSDEETALLSKSIKEGRTVKDIANISGRTQSSIRSKAKGLPKEITPTEDLNKALDENTGYSPEFEAFMKAREENLGNNPGYAGKDFTDRFSFDRTKLPQAVSEVEGNKGFETFSPTRQRTAANQNKDMQIETNDPQVEKNWLDMKHAFDNKLPLMSPVVEEKLMTMNPAGAKKLKQFETEMDYKYNEQPGMRGWLRRLTETEADKYRKLFSDIDKIRPVK